jgi:hypothetical protein
LDGIAIGERKKKPVHLIWYDDRSQISWVQSNVLRLLQQDRTDILFGLWTYSYEGAMTRYLQSWIDQLRWQSLQPMEKLAQML